ncbi:MAG: hypothetical protein U9O20_00865 [Patescibacteria group bacterium]|nr:hypothetical protein [Patescibacteria group bacterium]
MCRIGLPSNPAGQVKPAPARDSTMEPVNFQDDERMTCVGSGNVTIILKRLEQFNNVIPFLIAEWQLLNE